MEPIELEAIAGEPLGDRCMNGATEGARRRETNIVQKDD
jgi:hypothetical protein